ncbi:hypothetical protein CgunFtcFv8_007979 [Champsocephalus gunnari]|uniref:Uncharacterized protein n=1 Tax=Champsocephalus gunnari TaxID=52237 RepID=A0AAN8HFJ0_CHAGU|nr:hypothetical protein CgunFtcFv8_007979 [Champsocephalus gunnari]
MEANMDGNKEEKLSLRFAVPPYGPSWCRRAELAARKRRIDPDAGGRGEVSGVVLRSEIPQQGFFFCSSSSSFCTSASLPVCGQRDGGRNSAG